MGYVLRVMRFIFLLGKPVVEMVLILCCLGFLTCRVVLSIGFTSEVCDSAVFEEL